MDVTKICSRCGDTKALSDFGKDRGSYMATCKSCWRVRQKGITSRYRARRPAEIEYPAVKHCSDCDHTKPAAEFAKNRSQASGLSSQCRACSSRRKAEGKRRRGMRADSEIPYPGSKACSKCGLMKAASHFDRQRTNTDGLASACKQCATKGKRFHLYGLTSAEFEQMRAEHPNCEVCGVPFAGKRVNVDHCHRTNKVRGLLCNNCNLAEGLLKSSVEISRAMTAYLQKHEGATSRATLQTA